MLTTRTKMYQQNCDVATHCSWQNVTCYHAPPIRTEIVLQLLVNIKQQLQLKIFARENGAADS
jgi:hypothetical protein